MSSGLDAAVDALSAGLLVGFPTDTVYGIAADPSFEAAVEGLFAAKGRPGIKPIPVLAASLDDVRTVAIVDATVESVADRHWPGGITLIARRAAGVPDWIGSRQHDTVGVRIPAHPTALALLERSGPLAVTSANRSGSPPASSAAEAEAHLGPAISVYVAGEAGGGSSSTVVDLSGPEPRVLRRGPVEWPDASEEAES